MKGTPPSALAQNQSGGVGGSEVGVASLGSIGGRRSFRAGSGPHEIIEVGLGGFGFAFCFPDAGVCEVAGLIGGGSDEGGLGSGEWLGEGGGRGVPPLRAGKRRRHSGRDDRVGVGMTELGSG